MNDNGRNTLVEKALDAIRREKMLGESANVLVALSGGADSMALLHFFLRHKDELGIKNLSAAHVNHRLRGGESDRDEGFVAEQCRAFGVSLYLHRVDVAKEARQSGVGVVEAGRRVRYRFFCEIAAKTGFCVATAHTLNDSIETVLLNQTRGCGLSGLYGIPAVRMESCGGGIIKIIRPLIYCTRADVEEFCAEYKIPFVEDSTNAKTDFARNRIRIFVTPVLKSINPGFELAFLRMMRQAREDGGLLDKYAEAALNDAAFNDGYGGYDAEALSCLPPALRSRAVALAVKKACGELQRKISRRHISLIEGILDCGGAVDLSGQVRARVSQRRLTISRQCGETEDGSPKISLSIGISCEFYGKIYRPALISLEEFEKRKKINKNLLKYAFNYDKIFGKLFLRSRMPGDTFRPSGRGVSKKLKKLFIDEKIPAHLRHRVPIVCDQQGIVLVGGFGCDDRVSIDQSCGRVFVLETLE